MVMFFGCVGREPTGSGSVTLVLTDAASDQLDVFEVDVVQVTLRKLNGAVVTTLPRRQRVDFASLTDVSQILVGVRLPAGYYRSAVMTLDFSNALVLLNGSSTPAAIYDADGNQLTGLYDVVIEFDDTIRPNIAVRRNRLLQFDFNLDSSVTVDSTNNKVYVSPVISASVDPSDPKPVNVFGKLVSVDKDTGKIVLAVHNPRTGGVICNFTVATSSTTIFQVDGIPVIGANGLDAFSKLAVDTCVLAHGTVDTSALELKATFVEGGAGVPGNGQDWVEGLIVARTGSAGQDPILTIRGRSYNHEANSWSFNQTLTVNAEFSGTAVLRRAHHAVINTDYLNVGQRITAYGTLNGMTLDATGAKKGVIRCIRTDIFGFAKGPISGGRLTIDMVRIGLCPIANFNFTVSGVTVADPANFVLDTGSLSAPSITAGTPLRVRGFIAPLTAASTEPDFSAETIIDRSDVASLLYVKWFPARASAFASISPYGIALNLTGATDAVVDHGFVGLVNLNTTPVPYVTPKYAKGCYIILEKGIVTVYADFSAFSADLDSRISPTASRVYQIFALGKYTSATQTLSASVVTVILK